MELRWYVADLLFAQATEETCATVLCESSQVLLEALNADHAYVKAMEWARRHEEDSSMKLVGVRHLHSLTEPPGDGCEVGGGFFEEPGIWERRDELIPPKDEIPVLVLERNPNTPVGELIDDETKAKLHKLFP